MKLTKCIKDGKWDALFDELDADKNGALAHSEFWAKMALKNSSSMIDALDQFDVSLYNLSHFDPVSVDFIGRVFWQTVKSVKSTTIHSES